MKMKRVTLRVMVTVPEDQPRLQTEIEVETALDKSPYPWKASVRQIQEDPIDEQKDA